MEELLRSVRALQQQQHLKQLKLQALQVQLDISTSVAGRRDRLLTACWGQAKLASCEYVQPASFNEYHHVV